MIVVGTFREFNNWFIMAIALLTAIYAWVYSSIEGAILCVSLLILAEVRKVRTNNNKCTS